MHRNVLYLLTKPVIDPLLQSAPQEHEKSVVLLQDGVLLHDVPAQKIYYLTEDADARNVSPPGKPVSYGDIVQLIFDAEGVVAL